MYLRRTTRRVGSKTYHNYLLVESVATPKGPRQRVLCSLGALAPGPKDEWLGTARRLHAALAGQTALLPDAPVEALAARVRPPRGGPRAEARGLTIDPEGVRVEDEREAGPVHVGHQMWRLLQLNTILGDAGLSPRAQLLTEVMTLNRLVRPAAEHAMPDWIRRTALADILDVDFATLSDEALYRNLDRLHPQRAPIEQALAARERTLFNLDDTIYLYDLTSTYFEGQCKRNPQAKRGYSRDHRPDCKQVVIGLVLIATASPKRTKSSMAIAMIRRPWKRCSRAWRSARGAAAGPRSSSTAAWRSRRTWNKSGRTGITTSWPRATRNGRPTTTRSPTTRTGPPWSASRPPATRGRRSRPWSSSGRPSAPRSTSSVAVRPASPRIARSATRTTSGGSRRSAACRRGSRTAACATPARSRKRSGD